MARLTLGVLFAMRLLSTTAVPAHAVAAGSAPAADECESPAPDVWAQGDESGDDAIPLGADVEAGWASLAGPHWGAEEEAEEKAKAGAEAGTEAGTDDGDEAERGDLAAGGEVDETSAEEAFTSAEGPVWATPDAPVYVPPDVPTLIADAALRWGLDQGQMLRVAWCESRWNPGAQGPGGAAGVFQFIPSTWRLASAAVNMGYASPYDPVANIEAASWLMATQGPRHWTCR